MNTVVTALPYFQERAERVASAINAEFIHYHSGLFSELYRTTQRIVAIMAIGIVIRNIAPLIHDKWTDPAVVVISPDMQYAIPVLGGHHGANDLVYLLQERCGLTPVITTATEATGREAVEVLANREHLRIVNTRSTRQANASVLTGSAKVYRLPGPGMVIAGSGVSFLVADGPYSVGIGCRLGTSADEIVHAIHSACETAGISQEDIAIYATGGIKTHESGLLDAVRTLGRNIIFLNHSDLSEVAPPSQSAASRFGLPGVAEPAALAVSVHHHLILEKQIYGNVTIAIAE
ncbi:cobalamin (vitamin B12) biosynthesis CbiG protein [Methanospirillum hungatei JF-1]|uniref:Cobalamin (Vitamin B12) biosynthesis CbiG protein n=1 Tax=Methanospirillum hungatei JF-1 (strain ATCC 27890 / DSM 864 / NBRC 100397 / JF-1) TaxID=323259 RepID=Q2FRR6_METHJ|nr:cobalt-precorrin 5A hydrolase [Methanospirillum hungatei]ABD42894.1 cobalamin (vitamin B12) biosynthesis CbiG protein [Methanospirillum hungatei JF-1]